MPLKRIKRPIKPKRRDPVVATLSRMGDVVLRLHSLAKTKAAKQKALEAAVQYHTSFHDHMFLRIRQVINRAEREGNWQFMTGCTSQAVEVYAVASLSYEKFDESMMPDSLFDALAAFLLKNYESMTDFCKETWKLNKDIFRAGTGSHFTDPKELPDLLPYYNRLQAHYETEAKKRERIRAKNKTRLLRKTPHGGQSKNKGILRRPARRA